jgi:hypothetical protein
MPTIKRFANCRIEIRTRDHLPPHFHVVISDGRNALVEIETLAMLGPIDPDEITAVLEWARANRDVLMEEWQKWHP